MCFLDMERLIATEQMEGEVACLRCRGGAKLSQSLDKPPTVKLYISLELRQLHTLHFTSLVFTLLDCTCLAQQSGIWKDKFGIAFTTEPDLLLPHKVTFKNRVYLSFKMVWSTKIVTTNSTTPTTSMFEQQIRGTCPALTGGQGSGVLHCTHPNYHSSTLVVATLCLLNTVC